MDSEGVEMVSEDVGGEMIKRVGWSEGVRV